MTQEDLSQVLSLTVLAIPEQTEGEEESRVRVVVVVCVQPFRGEDGGAHHVGVQVLPDEVAELGHDQRLRRR